MKKDDSRGVFKASIAALTLARWGGTEAKDHVSKLAKLVTTSRSQATRLLEGSDVSVSMLDRLAEKFGAEPWQLLVPDFSAAHPPTLATGSAAVAARFTPELIAKIEALEAEDLRALENTMRSFLRMDVLPRPEGFQSPTPPKSGAQNSMPGDQPDRRINGDRRTGTA